MEKPDIQLAVDFALDLGADRGRRLLEVLSAAAVLREFDRRCAVNLAMDLLQQQWRDKANGAGARRDGTRPVIRDRLMQRYGMSRSSAYTCIDEAVQELSKVSVSNWTSAANNPVSPTAGDLE